MRTHSARLWRACAVLAMAAAATVIAGGPAANADPVPDTSTDVPNGRAHAAARDPETDPGRSARAMAPPAGYPINGIDVSSHDHDNGKTVNWAAQRAAGDEFAYVKATEHTGYKNPFYSQDLQGAKAAGLYVGAYHFGRPDLGNPVGQANYFVDNMQWSNDGRTLPPFLDMEWPYNGLPDCYGLSQSDMRSWISSFLTQVEGRIGRTPMIYTNVNWWNPCTGSSTAFARYGLDISSCNSAPPSVPGWGTRWTFWQYDIDACGRGAAHDSNVFNGSLTDLAALAGGGSASFGGVVAADVTGDGRADVVARKPDGSLLLYANGGSNTAPYSAGATIGSSWQGFRTVTAGDVNGDGRADLLAVGSDGSLVRYLNNGSATYPYSSGTVAGSGWQGFSSVLAAEVNGDGRADLLAIGADGSLRQYVNTGSDSAPFSSGAVIGSSWQGFRQVVAGDVNGDGKADLLAIGTDGSLRQYLNNGSASFPYSASAVIGSGWNFRTVMAGDVTGDGRADLMTVSTDGTLRLYTNTGNDTGPYNANLVIGSGWNNFA
jgi:GH25 family lysozyme M1 (1,4-beta-N-acetylmuramidase)